MRLVAAAVVVAVALGSSAAGSGPTARVDLIIQGEVIDEAVASLFAEPEDNGILVDPDMQFDSRVRVDKIVRGHTARAFVQVVSIRKSNLRRPQPRLWWLKQRPDGRFDLVCALGGPEEVVANRLDPAPDRMVQVPKDWRRSTPCDRVQP